MEQVDLKRIVKEFLDRHHKMVLSVIDKNGHPNASLLLYAIDDDLNVYFGTRTSFGKYAALKRDARVAVAIVQEGVDPLQVVDMQGFAEEIHGSDTEARLKWFTEKNGAKYYVKDAPDYVMFRIHPSVLRWLDATSGNLEMHDLHMPVSVVGIGAMARAAIRKTLIQVIGWVLVIFGVIGIVLPFLQGIIFLAAGLTLLSVYDPKMHAWLDRFGDTHPHAKLWKDRMQRFITRLFGKP